MGIQLVSVLAASVRSVRQVVKVRVLPTDLEAAALGATLSACNSAASWLSAAMHKQRVRRKYDAHKHFYTELRASFGLSAQPAIRVIGKVADGTPRCAPTLPPAATGHPGRPAGPRWLRRRSASAMMRPSRSINSAGFLRTKPRPPGWCSFTSTLPTRAKPAMRADGSTNATDVRKQYSSVAGVASLGTPTTMQRSTSPPAVSNAGAK